MEIIRGLLLSPLKLMYGEEWYGYTDAIKSKQQHTQSLVRDENLIARSAMALPRKTGRASNVKNNTSLTDVRDVEKEQKLRALKREYRRQKMQVEAQKLDFEMAGEDGLLSQAKGWPVRTTVAIKFDEGKLLKARHKKRRAAIKHKLDLDLDALDLNLGKKLDDTRSNSRNTSFTMLTQVPSRSETKRAEVEHELESDELNSYFESDREEDECGGTDEQEMEMLRKLQQVWQTNDACEVARFETELKSLLEKSQAPAASPVSTVAKTISP